MVPRKLDQIRICKSCGDKFLVPSRRSSSKAKFCSRSCAGDFKRLYLHDGYICCLDTGCWNWIRGCSSAGYGYVRYKGEHIPAHRAVYIDLVGAIPEGFILDHLCRNTRCVNPGHLEVVTFATNVRRGNKARLNESAVKIIRNDSVSTHAELAKRFDVTPSAIAHVRQKLNWKDVSVNG